MDNRLFEKKIEYIIHALERCGYDPYTQLSEYLRTGDPLYITRQDDARKLIQFLDHDSILHYLNTHF